MVELRIGELEDLPIVISTMIYVVLQRLPAEAAGVVIEVKAF